MKFVKWIKDLLVRTPEESIEVARKPKPAKTQGLDTFPRQRTLNDNVNGLIREDLGRLKAGLEKVLGERLIIGHRSHDDYLHKGGLWRPTDYRQEHSRAGYLLFYLARLDADHANGPIVETDTNRIATWIVCANATGLCSRMELFDPMLQQDVVEILNDAYIPHVIRITVHTVYPRRRLDESDIKGVIEFGKHIILPRSRPVPYRCAAHSG